MYKTIYLDPPWNEQGGGKIKRGADRHYKLMKTKDIITLLKEKVLPEIDDNAHLYIWVTNNFMQDGFKVIEALGFRYITCITWMKGQPPLMYANKEYDKEPQRVPREVFLYNLGYTAVDIAKLMNVCDWTIRDRLKKYGIKLRPKGKLLNTESLTQRQKEIIDGEMLGDGHLSLRGAYTNAHLQFHFKRLGHCELLFNEFIELNPQITKRKDIGDKEGWRLWTQCNTELTKQHNRWYNDKIKIVPKDLVLTPNVCFHWYIGDGTLTKSKAIVLYSLGFTYDENVFLQQKLKEIGFETNIHKRKYPSGIKYALYIPKKYATAFLDYIGTPVDVMDYAYKWGEPDKVINGDFSRCSLGQYYRGMTEHCLFAVKGMVPYKIKDGKRQQGVTGFIEKKTTHSTKPETMRKMIERVSTGPYLEYFARQHHKNWTCKGDEIEIQDIMSMCNLK